MRFPLTTVIIMLFVAKILNLCVEFSGTLLDFTLVFSAKTYSHHTLRYFLFFKSFLWSFYHVNFMFWSCIVVALSQKNKNLFANLVKTSVPPIQISLYTIIHAIIQCRPMSLFYTHLLRNRLPPRYRLLPEVALPLIAPV